MAACTFSARLVIDLAIVIASPTIIDASRQRVTTATEDTTRTARVCDMAAAKVVSVLGDVGAYDTSDGSIGDLQALDIGLRIAMHLYLHHFSLIQTTETDTMWQNLLDELDGLAARRSAEVPPQLGQLDLTELDRLYPTTPPWSSDAS